MAKFDATENVCNLHNVLRVATLHNATMSNRQKYERHFLAQWREFRNLTQEELGEMVSTTGSVISLLENGHRDISLKWLSRLAPALKTSPGYILDHDPNDLPTDILEIWNRADIGDRQKIIALASVIVPKANVTGG